MVTHAVILAAGRGTRLAHRGQLSPKGFLQIGSEPIIKESLHRLYSVGITSVTIVTGHLSSFYDELAENDSRITTVHNNKFAVSGSMYSLFLLKNKINKTFFLLESDLVYETRALRLMQQVTYDNCLLVSGLTESDDEVWVEARQGKLWNLSKKPEEIMSAYGELVGITKLAPDFFQHMCSQAMEYLEKSLNVEYETILAATARKIPVPCLKVEDLLWAEIDTEEHLNRVREKVYAAICSST